MSDGYAILIEAFRSFSFDTYIAGDVCQKFGDTLTEFSSQGDDLGSSRKHRVDVDDAVSGGCDLFERSRKKMVESAFFQRGSLEGKKVTDISSRDGAKKRIGDGMEEYIAVEWPARPSG